MRNFLPMTCILSAIVANSASAALNIVIDPSFENPSDAVWSYFGSAGLDDHDGGHTGSHSAYINLLAPDSGSIQQEVLTAPGSNYLVDFWLASNITGSGIVSVSFAGNTGFSQSLSSNLPYTEYSFVATAETTNSLLDISSAPADGTIFIDDVSVTAIPEPVSFGLVGVSAMGLILRRRRP